MHKDYQISAIKFKKIDSQLIDSFRILKRIGRLIYYFELFDNMRIHDVISVTHLKSVIDSTKNSYQRRRSSSSTIMIDNQNEYHVEKLIRKKRIR